MFGSVRLDDNSSLRVCFLRRKKKGLTGGDACCGRRHDGLRVRLPSCALPLQHPRRQLHPLPDHLVCPFSSFSLSVSFLLHQTVRTDRRLRRSQDRHAPPYPNASSGAYQPCSSCQLVGSLKGEARVRLSTSLTSALVFLFLLPCDPATLTPLIELPAATTPSLPLSTPSPSPALR